MKEKVKLGCQGEGQHITKTVPMERLKDGQEGFRQHHSNQEMQHPVHLENFNNQSQKKCSGFKKERKGP